MKKLLFIILLASFSYGQDYKTRDSVVQAISDINGLSQTLNSILSQISDAISGLSRRIGTLETNSLNKSNITSTTGGTILGYYPALGDPPTGLENSPKSLNIDLILPSSTLWNNSQAEQRAMKDSLNALTSYIWGSGGVPTKAPIYTFNYSPTLYFGDTKEVGQDSSKIVYIKNTGTATLKVTSLTYELVGGSDLVFTHTLKNHTSGADQDTVSVGDSVKLTITYTPTANSIGALDEWNLIVTSNGGANDTLFLSGTGKAISIAADSWQSVGIGAGGWFRSIKYHTQNRSIVYMIGDLSGFYKSTDGGSTWSPKNNGLTNLKGEDIAVHPTNGDILCIATDGGIFRSSDAGENWTNVGTDVVGTPSYTEEQKNIMLSSVHIAEANPNVWYAGTSGYFVHSHYAQTNGMFFKLFKSTNNGVNWDSATISSSFNSIRNDNSIISITTNPSNENGLWLSTKKYLLKSYNGGQTYQTIDNNTGYKLTYNGTTYGGAWCAAVDPKDTSKVYAGLMSTSSTQYNNLRVSTNGGTTWSTVNASTIGAIAEEIKFDKANTNKIYAGWRKAYTNQFYVSLDNGASWNSRGVNQSNINSGWYVFEPVTSFDVYNDTLIYCANMIARSYNADSTDMGLTQVYCTGRDPYWSGTGAEIKIVFNHFFIDSNKILASTDDSQLMQTTNGGTSWRVLKTAGGFTYNSVPLTSTRSIGIKDSLNFWAGQIKANDDNQYGTIIKTTDGGETWQSSSNGLPVGAETEPLAIQYVGGDTLLALIQMNGVYYSTNAGTNWTKSTALNGAFGSTTVARGESKYSGNLFAVDNNRKTIYVSVTQPQYATERNFRGMWKSTNAGISFTKYDTVNVRGVTAIAIHPDSSNIIWISQGSSVAGDGIGGVWKSTNSGQSFTKKYDASLSWAYFSSIAFDNTPGVMYATAIQADVYRGYWKGQGVYRSTDYGNNWSLYNDGLGGYHQILSVRTSQSHNQVFLGTQGHGAFKLIRATE